jgi:hypothetical protein
MAQVFCVIVGFYLNKRKRTVPHRIFEEGKDVFLSQFKSKNLTQERMEQNASDLRA